jgi:kinetochore protein NNF1
MAAHLGPLLNAQQSALQTSLATLEEQNASLAETIIQQRAEMDTLVRGLETLVGDLQKAAEMVQSNQIRHLTEETRAMHHELGDETNK